MPVYIGADNIISPLGFTTEENMEMLLQGKIGVKERIFPFSESPFCCSVIDENVLKQQSHQLKNYEQYTRLETMCLLSIADVVRQSQIDFSKKENLLIVSTTKGNIDMLANKYPNIDKNRVYLSVFAKKIGDYFSCVNTPLVVSNACISGILAIIVAKRLIEEGTYKNIVVCGADLVTEFTLSGFKSFNAASDKPSKPFDKNRTGINLGEAAASILLSSNKISNVVIAGCSSANDANHISGPSRTGEGLFKAVSETLKESGVEDVHLISAHGTATEYNDEMEAIAFTRANLGHVPLNSLKGYYGHTLGAAGVLETIISLQSLKKNILIKSMGYELPGTSKEINVIKNTEEKTIKNFLKTASGFGGCNAAIIYSRN